MRRIVNLWPVWLYYIFPHCHINVTVFRKIVIGRKMRVFISLQLLSETFLRRIEEDIIDELHYHVSYFVGF